MKIDPELRNLITQARRKFPNSRLVTDLCDKVDELERANADGPSASLRGCPVCAQRRKKDKARVDRFRRKRKP